MAARSAPRSPAAPRAAALPVSAAPPPPPAARFHASGTELLHLGLSVAVLSTAFAFAFAHLRRAELFAVPDEAEIALALDLLPAAFVLVVLGFLLHELAHKVVAQRLALWAEFRASAGGLGLALLLCVFTTVIFAAPGAVLIVGQATRRHSGLISVAGPLTNIAVGFAFLPFLGSSPNPPELGPGVGDFFEMAVLVNALLAIFNLLPFPPLDGSKIVRWSAPAYAGLLALAGLLFYLGAFA